MNSNKVLVITEASWLTENMYFHDGDEVADRWLLTEVTVESQFLGMGTEVKSGEV